MAKLSQNFARTYLPVWLSYQKDVGTEKAAQRVDAVHNEARNEKWVWTAIGAAAVAGALYFNNIAVKVAGATVSVGSLLYANSRRKLQDDFNALQQMPEFSQPKPVDASSLCPYKLETTRFKPPQA